MPSGPSAQMPRSNVRLCPYDVLSDRLRALGGDRPSHRGRRAALRSSWPRTRDSRRTVATSSWACWASGPLASSSRHLPMLGYTASHSLCYNACGVALQLAVGETIDSQKAPQMLSRVVSCLTCTFLPSEWRPGDAGWAAPSLRRVVRLIMLALAIAGIATATVGFSPRRLRSAGCRPSRLGPPRETCWP